MNQPAQSPSKPFSSDFDGFAQHFLAREDALLLIDQLNQLMKSVQRHRGISMGILAGNSEFKEEFSDLQYQLERRLATLEAFARANQLLTERDKTNLSLAWETIRNNWEGDNLHDNFELHSHFIEQLLGMIVELAQKTEESLFQQLALAGNFSASDESFGDKRSTQQAKIIRFVCGDLPDLIEQVARIRGTAAYGAAVQNLEGLDERKIRYWVSSLQEYADTFRGKAELLKSELGDIMPKLGLVKQNELRLLQFLNTVETLVFLGKGGREGARRLFNMATDVIEVYWEVVNEGLAVVTDWHRQEMENWIRLR